MRKIYTLTLTGLMVTGLSSQALHKGEAVSATLPSVSNSDLQVITYDAERAVGDTLMYVPLPEIFVVNPADALTFDLQTFDEDGFTAAAAINPPWDNGTNYLLFYDPTPGGPSLVPIDALLHPDTAYYFGATSWFDPLAQADDWLTMGPITIPATGATFGYRVRTPDQDYRDGYKVYVGLIGLNPTDFAPSDEIFNKNDNSGVIAEDTVWTYRTHNVPAAYAGQQVYFGIQHEANDMFIIYFDEFLALEADNLGAEENLFEGFALNQVMPNPAKDIAYINYAIGKVSDVTFMVTDINGKVVATLYEGNKDVGLYNYPLTVTNLNSGVYFVTIKAGQFSATKKLMVTK